MELNKENYYSQESTKEYMSYSQFKQFCECEAKALALIEGTYCEEPSSAMLQGSYVDAHFSGEMDEFKASHPECFKKDGTLKAEFLLCEEIIRTIEEDQYFKEEFYEGDSQQILECEIAGVKFKAKIDNYRPGDKSVDWKSMRSVEPIWNEEQHRKVPFYVEYRYDLQGAIYQEAIRQNKGERLPHYLAVTTKTNPVEKRIYQFSQDVLDEALEEVKAKAPRYARIKAHEVEPVPCGKCDYCISKKKMNMFDIQLITKEDM